MNVEVREFFCFQIGPSALATQWRTWDRESGVLTKISVCVEWGWKVEHMLYMCGGGDVCMCLRLWCAMYNVQGRGGGGAVLREWKSRVALKFIHKKKPEGYITRINSRVALKFIHKNTPEGYITGINSRVAMKFIHKNTLEGYITRINRRVAMKFHL